MASSENQSFTEQPRSTVARKLTAAAVWGRASEEQRREFEQRGHAPRCQHSSEGGAKRPLAAPLSLQSSRRGIRLPHNTRRH
eukprot:2849985-Rhodomonas_salina.2